MADWRVDVRDDDVNTRHAVTYLLHRLCGMSVHQAAATMARVHRDGSAEVARFGEQDAAERLAVRLQTYGLHATVRGIR